MVYVEEAVPQFHSVDIGDGMIQLLNLNLEAREIQALACYCM
jgi:hypothetical protein